LLSSESEFRVGILINLEKNDLFLQDFFQIPNEIQNISNLILNLPGNQFYKFSIKP